MAIADHIKGVVVTDVGTIDVPPHIQSALDTVPRRKNGNFDKRFAASKKAYRWVRDVKTLAFSRWSENLTLTTDELPPLM